MKFLLGISSLLLVQSASAFSYLSSLAPNGATTSTSYAPNGQAGAGSSIHPHVASPATSTGVIGPSEQMLTLISRQVSVELAASQAYMAASIWFRARNMDGMAAWMLDESDEERGHGKEILVSLWPCRKMYNTMVSFELFVGWASIDIVLFINFNLPSIAIQI